MKSEEIGYLVVGDTIINTKYIVALNGHTLYLTEGVTLELNEDEFEIIKSFMTKEGE